MARAMDACKGTAAAVAVMDLRNCLRETGIGIPGRFYNGGFGSVAQCVTRNLANIYIKINMSLPSIVRPDEEA
jgi:hypothetical protein